jgi:hypothetical protein
MSRGMSIVIHNDGSNDCDTRDFLSDCLARGVMPSFARNDERAIGTGEIEHARRDTRDIRKARSSANLSKRISAEESQVGQVPKKGLSRL